MYRERASRLPGSLVWMSIVEEGQTRVLPGGCMDLIGLDDSVLIAGPDNRAHLFSATQSRRLSTSPRRT